MKKITIQGGIPLSGTVKISGAKNSALKLIHASMFSNEDVTLNNVPQIQNVEDDIEIIKQMGGYAQWQGPNRLVLNGSGLNTYEVPSELGSKNRTALLMAAPLLYRFGKAILPLPGGCKIGLRPVNRWLDTWVSLGVNVEIKGDKIHLNASNMASGIVNFKISTHMGTENAIMSAAFVDGETIINNAAEESEIEDLISLLNRMGADINRVEDRRIKINGTKIFKGVEFDIQPDKTEVVTFAVAALVTGGNVHIIGVDKSHLLPFVNALTKIGCKFEFSKNEMRVWHAGEEFIPTNITTSIAPGFMTDWQPLITLLLTQADGESLVHDTVYTDRFEYTKDLNRMGANIRLERPSSLGLESIISDDAYDIKKHGEPYTVAKVVGPTKFKANKLILPDLRAGATLVLAALCAEGKSEITGYDQVLRGYESFTEKLVGLGAHIEVSE